jgi:hypothetical protein
VKRRKLATPTLRYGHSLSAIEGAAQKIGMLIMLIVDARRARGDRLDRRSRAYGVPFKWIAAVFVKL